MRPRRTVEITNDNHLFFCDLCLLNPIDDIIKRLEEATGLDITASGFPAQMIDDEAGVRVTIARGLLSTPLSIGSLQRES